MRYKPLLIYLFISSIFLTLLGSIWKIMATLQGLNLTNINFNINFLLALILSFTLIFIGKKINQLIKIITFSLIFTTIYVFIYSMDVVGERPTAAISPSSTSASGSYPRLVS